MEWHARLNQAFDYIEAHLYALDYEIIGRLTLCPVGILQRFFALNIGVTLTEYVRNRRLSEAGLALQFGNRKVLDLALDSGYDSGKTFSVAFKNFHGVTPTEARRPGAVLRVYPRFKIQIQILQEGATLMEKIQALNAKIAQTPKDVLLLLERMEAYFEMKEYRLAVADLKAVNDLTPSQGNIGCEYIGENLYEADLDRLDQAAENQAEAFRLHIMGCSDYIRARFAEATDAIQKAVALDPDNPWFYHTLCETYWQRGDYTNGLQAIENAVRLNPGQWNHYDKRGWMHRNLGDRDKMTQDWLTALQLGQTQAKRLLPLLLRDAPDFKKIVSFIDDLYKNNPQDQALFEYLGDAVYRSGDYARSVTIQNQLIADDPQKAGHWNCRGAAHFNLGNYAEAVTDYTQVIALEKNTPVYAYQIRGAAHYLLQNYAEAVADFAHIRDRGCHCEHCKPPHYLWLGKSQLKAGHAADAVQNFTEALDRKHKNPSRLYELRAEAYRALGDDDKAAADLDKSTALKDLSDIAWHV